MVKSVVGMALRHGVRKGVVGGSNPWLVVAVAAAVVKLLSRTPRGQTLTMNLKPGERYIVACGDESTARASR